MLLASILTLALAVPPVGAPDVPEARPATVVDIIHDRAAAHQVSGAALERLSWCESRHDPNATGDSGTSRGLFQINDRGLASHFRAQGYDSPYDAWASADYVARVMSGEWPGITLRHWSCWGR